MNKITPFLLALLIFLFLLWYTTNDTMPADNDVYTSSVDYYNRAFLGLDKPYVPEMWKAVKSFDGKPVDFEMKK